MKAITLCEPWASWIAQGFKTIETRTHDGFRGLVGERIAIHAGLKYDNTAIETMRRAVAFAAHPMPTAVCRMSQIVCTAEVHDARWLLRRDSPQALITCDGEPLRYGLFLRNIFVIHDTLTPGRQGIWNWTPPAGLVVAPPPRLAGGQADDK